MRSGPFARLPFLAAAFAGCLLALPAARAADLTVSAAVSLANAFREIADEFEETRSGVRVHTNFGASGTLLQQILRGAPVDVFACADRQTMDRAQSAGLLAHGWRHDFASNRLVLIVPVDSELEIGSLADLARAAPQRIAIGTPGVVPAGSHARLALQEAGLWERLQSRMVGAQNVRQALDYVARGEVDAGFVYATDAAHLPGRVRIVLEVPSPAITYPIAALAGAADPALAQAFVEFVRSARGQAILADHGFGPP